MEEIAVCASHKVLVEFDDNSALIASDPWGILGLTIQASLHFKFKFLK
jgi:hypothetical protein